MIRLPSLMRAAFAAMALCLSASAFAQYPNRPITLVVPWGAGGGTDAVARFIASLMEKDLGQPVNVVNRTGGSGVVGHSAIATRRARRLHHRHDHRGNHDDAPPEADRAEPGQLHADRAGQPRPGRLPGACRFALQDHERRTRRDQGQPGQVQGLGHRPGRHLAPGAGRHAERREDRPGHRALGAEQRRRAGPAGPGGRRRRIRALLAARGALADRGRQGAGR